MYVTTMLGSSMTVYLGKVDRSLIILSTYSRQKFSGLFCMVKRYYIQDYPENFRGNT